MTRLCLLAPFILVGCAGDGTDAGMNPPRDASLEGCDYPSATEPMAEGEVLSPHFWNTAIDGANNRKNLDLLEVYCNADDDIDWSPFDLLLFVSVPAW